MQTSNRLYCKKIKIFKYFSIFPEMTPVEIYFELLKRNVIKQSTGQQVYWKKKSRKYIKPVNALNTA